MIVKNEISGYTRNKIVAFLKEYHKEHGYMPPYDEILEAIGLYSKSSLWEHMNKLYDAGIIESEHRGCPRAYRLGRKSNE